MHTSRPILVSVAASLLLGACGLFGGGDKKEIIFDDFAGPATKEQIRSLPGDLSGDTENRRHGNEANAPEDMDPAG